MAINYAPMEPFDARVSEAYGASQSRQQAQQMALQAYGITQASSDRASERAQNEEQFNASYRQKFQMQDAAQAHDFAQAQQHTDLQAQLSQTQLNQAEQMRLQRLDRQIEYVQANSGSGGQYTPQEAQEMIGDLRMGRDPLQSRAQRAQILQHQWQTQQIMTQEAQAATRAKLTSRYANGEGPLFHTDEESGQRFYLDSLSGNWTPVRAEGGRSGAGSSTPRPLTANQTAGLRRSAERAVAMDPAFIGKPQADIDREVNARFQRWTSEPGAENLVPPRPIDVPDNTPLSAIPADQRGILRGLNADQAVLTGPNSRLSADERTELNADIAKFRSLFRQFGQISSMPPTERSEFLAIARRLDELTGRQRGPGQRPPEVEVRPREASPPNNTSPSESPFQGMGMS